MQIIISAPLDQASSILEKAKVPQEKGKGITASAAQFPLIVAVSKRDLSGFAFPLSRLGEYLQKETANLDSFHALCRRMLLARHHIIGLSVYQSFVAFPDRRIETPQGTQNLNWQSRNDLIDRCIVFPSHSFGHFPLTTEKV
jgi:hypothetical protein